MANLNIDIVEEDAADLQFPKDWTSNNKHYKKLTMPVKKEEHFTLGTNCFICKCIITEPYIHCAICNCVMLCATCFANGKEKLGHENNHSYMIIQNDFPLIKDSSWSAREVKNLLGLLHEFGFGNWKDISNKLPGRSAKECERYYVQYFINNQSLPNLPKFKESITTLFNLEPLSFIFKLENIEDPPRFATGTTNYKLMGGYNTARSDFEVNFDNHAELELCKLKYNSFNTENQHCALGESLQMAMCQAYNTRLKERDRRRKIIRNHGLISIRKMISCLLRCNCTLTRPLTERMRIFSQILDGIEFDSMMECFHQIGELKSSLKQLFIYRKNGLKHFHSAPLFDELNKLRQEYDRDRKQYTINTDCHWQKIIPLVSSNTSSSTNLRKRKIAPPLDIHSGMKEYDKLDRTERDLCSVVRILPELYIEMKHLLISENKKCGSITLAQARQLLKIDVNKTKKIHEFLAKQNYIRIN